MKTITAILFLVVSVLSYSQTSKINQLDSAGKKDGKWIVWLDSNWKKLDDSTKAVYFRYTYYGHGVNIYPMGPCGKKNWKLEISGSSGEQRGKVKMLDGEYKWLDEKGKISSAHVLKNGEYISCKEYYSSGELNQFFDYTKKCTGEIYGWTLFIYDKTGKVTLQDNMCREKNGQWPKTRG